MLSNLTSVPGRTRIASDAVWKKIFFIHFCSLKVTVILRKIFDPVQNEDGFWRIRMNHELKDLIKKRRYSEICKKQKNGLAGSCDADGRRKNTHKSTGVETSG
jgi:hypothetical protein